ncbi:hypothetical protein RHMOL_Rhmol04G0255900 [Rhododendron molle]|uniref:Uncharacterized protein n=1 Tax=Rhododendron molle TaxID=49168 RepID=A0ACC0P5M9_RHOML|nr:hypothetical protein RHMOL_Rhmol04G0255900 [Rhododendron molle]
MSSFSSTPNFDNLLLQALMGRLQIGPPPNHLHSSSSPLLNQTLEDLIFDATTNQLSLSDTDDDYDETDNHHSNSNKTQLAKEESKLEKDVIKTILSGDIETLKPNSGQAVAIGDHHICVGFHRESDSDYRVWEWHGHIMLFDEENGYTPEYIYGNYFERMPRGKVVVGVEKSDEREKNEESEKGDECDKEMGNLGLRELIGSGDSGSGRILHRNLNAGSPSGFRSRLGWALSGGGGLLAGEVVSPVCLCGGCGVLHEIRVLGVWSRPEVWASSLWVSSVDFLSIEGLGLGLSTGLFLEYDVVSLFLLSL